MFGHRFFGTRYYGPRYFGGGGISSPVGLPPKRKFYEAREAEGFDYLRDDEDVMRLLMEALPGIIKAQLKRRKK